MKTPTPLVEVALGLGKSLPPWQPTYLSQHWCQNEGLGQELT